jgi:GWxTD domain-containing protein
MIDAWNHRHISIMKSILIIMITLMPMMLFSQFRQNGIPQKKVAGIFVDALWFKSDGDSMPFIDVYAMIPYEALQFTPEKQGFSANISISLSIRDTTGKKIAEQTIDRALFAETYEQSRGANAEFNHVQFRVPAGFGYHTCFVNVHDAVANTDIREVRTVTIPKWSRQEQAHRYLFSSVMYASAIEEKNDKKIVMTPHLSDNVAGLIDGFFLYVELYHFGTVKDETIGITYMITDEKQKEVFLKSVPISYSSGRAESQHLYIPVKQMPILRSGNYVMTIMAHTMKNDSIDKELTRVTRVLTIEKTISGIVYQDLKKAIRQLRFIATQAEIDHINEGEDDETKRMLFEEYWKGMDPNPSTSRNEAFEEYYGRIDYANKNFRSYTEGWMTDMGMVYIVFGQPFQVERTPRGSDGRTFARWIYQNQRQFTFVDNSGFEDFRLTSPFPTGIKYRYSGTQ